LSPADLTQLAKLWAMYAAYYRTTVDDQVLRMYASDLSDLDLADVRLAMEKYRKNSKNRALPMPAMIRDLMQPAVDEDAQAREIAARISGAVVKFGWCNSADAQKFIGPVGWRIVETRGGWTNLCQNLGITIDPTSFEAQVREQAKAAVKYGDEALSLSISPSEVSGELESAKEILSLIQAKNMGGNP
jgi:hypothetical protein